MHEPYVLLSITSDVRPKVLILLPKSSFGINSLDRFIGVLPVNVSSSVTFFVVATTVILSPHAEVHEAWRVELGEGSLITGGHHWPLSQVLKSHIWVQIRNDVLTHGRSHKHLFVVHARVSEHHVPMVLGVEVSELN